VTEEEAGQPKSDVKEYKGAGIVVRYDPALCIKAGECGRGLPQVFRAGQKPWADPDAASVDEVVEVVLRCPASALTYERLDGGPNEEPDDEVTIEVQKGGPYHVRGKVRVTDHRGNVITELNRVALCRCGQSKNKPFCDGTHNSIIFK
jgi:uncharacterized Fe-S cluster protein YjdI